MYSRSLYARTIANGGGTFELHADNFERRDITSGYAVGMVVGTFATAHRSDHRVFNYGIARVLAEFNDADAIGTWMDGDIIHIDPVRIFANEDDAREFAIANQQLAYFNLDTSEEVRL